MMADTNHKTISFMLVGVGGQGTILASNVIAEVGLSLGYDVKQAEVHGMSQRGGSVTSHVRWAKHVYSSIITPGDADVLIAFEKSEVSRYIEGLKPGGIVLVNDYSIVPITVSSGGASYPEDASIKKLISSFTGKNYWIDGIGIAEEVGNARTANVVLLGALSRLMDFEEQHWVEVIKQRVPPKFLEMNLKAFERGREVIRNY